MNYVAKSIAIDRLDNDVDVVWHDAPGQKAVPLAIEVEQRILDQRSDFRSS